MLVLGCVGVDVLCVVVGVLVLGCVGVGVDVDVLCVVGVYWCGVLLECGTVFLLVLVGLCWCWC